MTKKIALFGGAFDPIHSGHIEICQYVLNNTDMDEVWISPCYRHMHGKHMTENLQRLAMCFTAADCVKDDRLHVWEWEIKIKHQGSTFDLLTKHFGFCDMAMQDAEWSYIIGLDNANNFDKWKYYDKLQKMIKFITVSRQGEEVYPEITWYKEKPHIFLEAGDEVRNISSTQLRELLKANPEEARKDLNSAVFEYIQEHKLYLK